MILTAILIVICVILLVAVYVLWGRVEVLLSAVAKLSSGLAEQQKFLENMLHDFDEENELIEKRISKTEEQLDELPIEQLREAARQEAEFMEGLNNILSYNVGNHGINRDGVKHE